MNIFYCNNIQDNIAILDENESRHCTRVLRMESGDSLQLVDGNGLLAECKILSTNPKQVQAEIVSRREDYGRLKYHLHLAIAPPKSHDRFEWFLEKAAEIGVSEITPLVCEHSERTSVRTARAEKILLSAMKQSHRAWLPVLNAVCSFKDFIGSHSCPDKFIAHCDEGNKITLKHGELSSTEICILIGPEGDFSAQELELAKEHEYRELSLNDFILRTETAGIAACTQISQIFSTNEAGKTRGG